MKVALAQIAPVLLDRDATLAKVHDRVREAAAAGAALVAFPETVVPGYPTWVARTHGAAFDDALQKELFARYLEGGLELPGPELEALRDAAREHGIAIVLGCAERGRVEGRGTLWACALTVLADGSWSGHRKLVPTYEERLVWGHGDGHGLVTHDVGGWRVGSLVCWENWMPAARMALYGQGEEVHVSLWPGSPGLTRDASLFQAREGRAFVLAASGVLRAEDVPADVPAREAIVADAPGGVLHSGGSRIVAPDGRELAALDDPVEGLVVAVLDRDSLARERQNFDVAGHYARPDVFELAVDRRRREGVRFRD